MPNPARTASVRSLSLELDSHLSDLGLESHPFLIQWYNELVGPKFQLAFPPNTLAFVILSQPSMFERTFLPFLNRDQHVTGSTDPLDVCMLETMGAIKAKLAAFGQVEVMHDFQLAPNRRPKVLVQTAAHVSGAVRFFRESDVADRSLLAPIVSPKIYPVCLHSRWGGWFAIRAVLVFKDVTECPWEAQTGPNLDLSQEQIAHLLHLYNDHWEDWRFRDVIPAAESYSTLQKSYFSTKPAERNKVLEQYRASRQ